MSEADLQRAVEDLAHLHRCLVHHCRPARTANGWRTPISGDAGFVDVVIVGNQGVLYRELKSGAGRLRPEQQGWLARLTTAGCDAGVWRPVDLHPNGGRIADEIRAVA